MFCKPCPSPAAGIAYKAFTFSELFPYAEYCPLKRSQPNLRRWTWEVVMTLFMGFTIAGYLSIIVLLWCLRGFSHELRNVKQVVEFFVRVTPDRTSADAVRIQRVLQRELKVTGLQPRNSYSLQSAKVVHLARVLGARR
jgi:hypothetical protein